RELRDRKHVGKLLVGQPVMHIDGDAMHLGDRGIGAADRKQRHQPEGCDQAENRIAIAVHDEARLCMRKVTARLIGIATSSTICSGQRARPMPAKTATISTSGGTSRLLS